ncbi:YunG family protein [Rummeliibacillus sp. JY-2-4R]
MKTNMFQIERITNALFKSWSLESSSKWSKDNASAGQCGVTTLVVNDILGGEIRKTKLPDGWHFYNFINNKRYDFTASQFKKEILYRDIPSNRIEAYADTNEKQYGYLRQKVLDTLFN